MEDPNEVKDFVKKRYGRIAEQAGSCCSDRATCDPTAQAKCLGYTEAEIKSIPPEAVALGLGCGNPTALADLKPGEAVVDLGSGGGVDVFLAANLVGPEGKAIGVDMTDEMLAKADQAAAKHGYTNVEFRKGEIEHLPVESESVDAVISNCVINLTVNKAVAYTEIFRILKPGGRMLISDLVTLGDLPEDVRESFDAWAGCIAGAMEKEAYLATIAGAGFEQVEVIREQPFAECDMDERLEGKIISVQVKASKPSPCCAGD